MTCTGVRKQLLGRKNLHAQSLERALSDHLDGCSGCRDFSRRLQAVAGELRDHHAGLEPDGSFVARVVDRLPVELPFDLLHGSEDRLSQSFAELLKTGKTVQQTLEEVDGEAASHPGG